MEELEGKDIVGLLQDKLEEIDRDDIDNKRKKVQLRKAIRVLTSHHNGKSPGIKLHAEKMVDIMFDCPAGMLRGAVIAQACSEGFKMISHQFDQAAGDKSRRYCVMFRSLGKGLWQLTEAGIANYHERHGVGE